MTIPCFRHRIVPEITFRNDPYFRIEFHVLGITNYGYNKYSNKLGWLYIYNVLANKYR